MKNVLMILSVSFMIYSCTSSKYTLNDYEKGKLKGYHANEANRLININQKNRKVNQEAAEKFRQEQAEKLNELNHQKKNVKNKRSFNMY